MLRFIPTTNKECKKKKKTKGHTHIYIQYLYCIYKYVVLSISVYFKYVLHLLYWLTFLICRSNTNRFTADSVV